MKPLICSSLFVLFFVVIFNSCKKSDSASATPACKYVDNRLTYDGNNRISKITFKDPYGFYQNWTIDYTTSPAKVKTYGSDGYETPGSVVILNSLGYVTKRSNRATGFTFSFDYDASGYLIKSLIALIDGNPEQVYYVYTYTDGNLSSVKQYISNPSGTSQVCTLTFTYYTDKLNTLPMQYLPNINGLFEFEDVYSIPNFTGKYSKNLIKTVTWSNESFSEKRSKQEYTYFNDANGNIGKMNIETTYYDSKFTSPSLPENRPIYFTYSCK
jgi:hypothetical protein